MVFRAKDANHIDAHCVLQVLIQQSQHLEWLVNAHRPLLKSVIVAQCGHATGVHTGDGSSTEIDRDAVRLLVVEGCNEPSRLRSYSLK